MLKAIKLKKLNILLMTLFLSLIIVFNFVACADGENNENVENLTPPQTETEETQEPQEIYYTVFFDTDGGTLIESQRVKKGEKAVRPDPPIKNNTATVRYSFGGWYLGEIEYDFDTAVNSDITITAKWNSKIFSDDIPI